MSLEKYMTVNLGSLDRGIRVVVGAIMVGQILFSPLSPGPGEQQDWPFYLTIVGAMYVLTAIAGWDPLYALLRLNSRVTKTPEYELEEVESQSRPIRLVKEQEQKVVVKLPRAGNYS